MLQFDNALIVDLTHTLSEQYEPTWPGDVRFQTHIAAWFSGLSVGGLEIPPGGECQTHVIHMSDHAGTHADAPSHFIPPPDSGIEGAGPMGLVTIDKIPVHQYFGPAAVINTRSHLGTSPDAMTITVELVKAWEKEHGPLVPGDVVLLSSGWDVRYRKGAGYFGPLDSPPDSYSWNSPDVACINYLVSRGVRAIGTDGPSIGPAVGPGAVHRAALSRGLGVVEGLAHLDTLPLRGAYFLFLPIKLGQGSGGPGRAVAFLPGQ